MNYVFLRDDTLEYGPDLRDWPRERQLAATIELLRRDENEPRPAWLADMLAEAAASVPWRQAIQSALSVRDVMAASQYALAALRTATVDYALPYLSERARDHEPIWRAEDDLERWVAELERRADAAREAAL